MGITKECNSCRRMVFKDGYGTGEPAPCGKIPTKPGVPGKLPYRCLPPHPKAQWNYKKLFDFSDATLSEVISHARFLARNFQSDADNIARKMLNAESFEEALDVFEKEFGTYVAIRR